LSPLGRWEIEIMSEIVEVLFKGEVRELFENPGPVILRSGDYVVVQADKGEDMGRVITKGEWVSKKAERPPVRQVVRKANRTDLDRREANSAKEIDAFRVCRERIAERELKMKLVDVECRFDGSRITFYFTAEKRVDFRELVKDLASVYKTRIELRQIGVRDEAKRVGGFGSCGRKFCCATFLREFEPVTLKMAKDQHLSLSPSKISGACGRLMCCLMYEVDAYRKSLHSYPRVGAKIKIGDREVQVNRVDIFREGVFVNDPEGGEDFIPIDKLPGHSPAADDNGGEVETEESDFIPGEDEDVVVEASETPEAPERREPVKSQGPPAAAERKGAEKQGRGNRHGRRRGHGRHGRHKGHGRSGGGRGKDRNGGEGSGSEAKHS
jgi:cell fate regulator YaaT (PSP1 superfamily)